MTKITKPDGNGVFTFECKPCDYMTEIKKHNIDKGYQFKLLSKNKEVAKFIVRKDPS